MMYTVDLDKKKNFHPLHIHEGDAMSRFFSLRLYNGTEPYIPPNGAVYSIRYEIGSNTGWYTTITEPNGGSHPAVVASGNVITCEIAEAATHGKGIIALLITNADGYQLAIGDIPVISTKVQAEDSEETENYYNMFGIAAEALPEALEVIDGIPQDYSEMAADVVNIMSSVRDVTLTETTGYIDGTGNIVTDPSRVTNGEVYSQKIYVIKGSVIKIEGENYSVKENWASVASYAEDGSFIERNVVVIGFYKNISATYTVQNDGYVVISYRTFNEMHISVSIECRIIDYIEKLYEKMNN